MRQVRSRFSAGMTAFMLGTTGLSGLVLLPAPAMAQDSTTVAFAIPAQPLARALEAFSRQSGWQVGFDASTARGKTAAAVSGTMTPAAALERLIAGQGYEVEITGARSAALVVPLAAATTEAAPSDAISLGTIRLDAGGVVTEGSGSYTSGYTTVATGLPLTMRETPQSISVTTRQKMDDRDQRSIGEVLEDTAGVTVMPMDTERRSVYARGFSSPTFMVDGTPVWYRIQYGSGPSISDTAIYDRVEVLRGATGLMAGAGDPSVAINMVRKSPTAFPQTSAKLSYGSWNTMRSELDTSGPLSEDGRLRGRIVLAHEDGESFLDRYERKKTIAYGTIEADVGDSGVFTLGYDYQLTRTRNHQFGGLPLIANDGSQLDYDRHVNAGGSNLPLEQKAETAFARYKHSFDNGWEAVGDLSFYRASRIGFLASASWGSPNPDGTGVQLLGGYADTRTEQTNISATLSGPVELWGRSHDLRFGVVGTFGKDTHRAGRARNGFDIDYTPITGSIFDWDGAVPGLESNADYLPYVTVTKVDQKAAYGSGRFWLADWVSFIGGARVVWYDYSYTTADSDTGSSTRQEMSRNAEWIPYAGLVYDINDTWSVYGSYTSIFKQPSYRDKDNRVLNPTTGANYELGVKAAFFDNQLNFSAAVFRLEQDDLPARDRSVSYLLPDGSFPWKSIDGATTKGFEAELGGELRPGLQVSASYAYTDAKDGTGARISTVTPRHSVKIAGSYDLENLPLTIGGALRWQSGIENTWTWPVSGTARQGAYTVVDLMARYQFESGLTATLGIDNVFDEKYLSSLDETYATGNYGTPRSATLTLNYRF
ncbi:TonB-dependent siderophore receptor [Pseudogemmobacter hezensis]|uniref:TonB-dependent siderophore receptor n=1 Tax=Pseudogemmobacter hezensis TaxID=2737662 RepID=UPI0020A6363E|nr:TonB-dependent receptor [Pseudogemmobacter hezensis]